MMAQLASTEFHIGFCSRVLVVASPLPLQLHACGLGKQYKIAQSLEPGSQSLLWSKLLAFN